MRSLWGDGGGLWSDEMAGLGKTLAAGLLE